MSSSLDPLRLDRELCRLANRWVNWRRQLRQGTGFEVDPFDAEWACGKTAFDAVSEWHSDEPLRTPLRRWIYRLAEQRINRPALARAAYEWRGRAHGIEQPIVEQVSLSELLRRVLRTPQDADRWFAALRRQGDQLGATRGLLWERRQELARRMGLAEALELEACAQNVATMACSWLDQTRDAMENLVPDTPGDYFECALGNSAEDDWPARLTLRHLADWFQDTDLLRALPIDPGPLPDAIGPASFLRALARLGASWSQALSPSDQPFVIAHDPWGLQRRSHGCLFGALPLNQTFLERKLGITRGRAPQLRRVVARVLLLESRASALRLLMRDAALQGRSQAADQFEALTQRHVGTWTSRSDALVIWAPADDAEQRFAGLLMAAVEQARLQETHDEDWWRNPRGVEELRALAQRPPKASVGEEQLQAGLDKLKQAILEPLLT